MKLNDKVYDVLKMNALVLVPILAFLSALINIWGVPHAEQIVASLTALDTLIGAIVAAVSKAYHKEESEVEN